jgi:ATP-dependent helicase HrpB
VLALAYPERVARRRPGGRGQFLLAGGRGAMLAETDPLASSEYLAVADLDAGRENARIFHAAPLTVEEIDDDFAAQIESVDRIEWDGRERAVLARRQRRLGALVLAEQRLEGADPQAVAAALLQGIRELGIGCLPWNADSLGLRQRVAFLRALDPDAGWPDWSDAALVAALEDWLAPFVGGMTRLDHVARVDLAAALSCRLSREQQRALDRAAPTHVAVPSGSRIAVDYGDPAAPVLAVRLQELFGLAETPRVGDGRVPLTLHLLSPARRPVQVTRDLASFWAGAYRQVRADLKGRYPKHHWPDDPLRAAPAARTKPRP